MPSYRAKPMPGTFHADDPLTRGAAAYAPLLAPGGVARNVANPAASATPTDPASWTRGEYGPCLTFDGISQYATYGNPPQLQITGALTIAVLMRSTSTLANRSYLSKYWAGGGQRGYSLGTGSSDGTKSEFLYQSNPAAFNSAQVLLGPTAPTDGQWHVIIGSLLPSTIARIYLDGRIDAESTTSIPATIAGNNTQAVEVARTNNATTWAGSLAAWAVLPRYLDAGEARALSRDWLSGTFRPSRPRAPVAALFAASPAPATRAPAMMLLGVG